MQRGPYRGDHIEAFTRGGKTYFRFNRTVPRELRRLLGKSAWRTHLKGAKSRQDARQMAERLGLGTRAALELAQLKGLTPDMLSELKACGGLDGWREQMKAAAKNDLGPMLEFVVRELAPQADDDAFVEWGAESILVDNAVARAEAERELAKNQDENKTHSRNRGTPSWRRKTTPEVDGLGGSLGGEGGSGAQDAREVCSLF